MQQQKEGTSSIWLIIADASSSKSSLSSKTSSSSSYPPLFSAEFPFPYLMLFFSNTYRRPDSVTIVQSTGYSSRVTFNWGVTTLQSGPQIRQVKSIIIMLKRIALAVFVLSIGSSCCISSSSSSTSSSLTKRGRIRIRDGGVSAAGFVMLRAAGHDRGKVQRRSTYGSSHVGGSMKEGTEGAATRSRRRRVSMAVGEGGGGGGRDKERGSIHNNNKKTRRGGGAVLSCSSNNHNHQEKAMVSK